MVSVIAGASRAVIVVALFAGLGGADNLRRYGESSERRHKPGLWEFNVGALQGAALGAVVALLFFR